MGTTAKLSSLVLKLDVSVASLPSQHCHYSVPDGTLVLQLHSTSSKPLLQHERDSVRDFLKEMKVKTTGCPNNSDDILVTFANAESANFLIKRLGEMGKLNEWSLGRRDYREDVGHGNGDFSKLCTLVERSFGRYHSQGMEAEHSKTQYPGRQCESRLAGGGHSGAAGQRSIAPDAVDTNRGDGVAVSH
jgi:hypothetical protein